MVDHFAVIAWALVALAVHAWRHELVVCWRWIAGTWRAFRREVRLLVDWVFQPDPLEGLTGPKIEPYYTTWPDEPPARKPRRKRRPPK